MINDSYWNYFTKTSNLQPSEGLSKLLNSTTLDGFQKLYPGISVLIIGYKFTLKQFLSFVIHLDSPRKSQEILYQLGLYKNELFLTNKSIATRLNSTAQNLTMKRYLTDFYISLNDIIPDLLNKTTVYFVNTNPHFHKRDLFMSPRTLKALAPGSVQKGYLLRLEHARDLISDNKTDKAIFKNNVKKYYDHLDPIIQRHFKRWDWFWKLTGKQVIQQCNVTESEFWMTSIANITQACMQVHYRAIFEITGLFHRELLMNFTFGELPPVFNITKGKVLNMTMKQVEILIAGEGHKGQFMFGPIVAEAYKAKIPISEILDTTIMNLAMKVLNRPEIVVRKWFIMTPKTEQVFRNYTFRNFSKAIQRDYNETFTVEFLYTVSFVGLFEDTYIRHDIKDLKVVFIDTSFHLTETYNWQQLAEMYSVNLISSMEMTTTSFFAKHTTASPAQLKQIFELTSQEQYDILDKIKLKDARDILRISQTAFSKKTPFSLKESLLAVSRSVTILFYTPDKLIKKISMTQDDLKTLSFVDLIQKAGKTSKENILKGLTVISNGREIFDMLKLVPVLSFMAPLKMSSPDIGNTQIYVTFKKISTFLSQCKCITVCLFQSGISCCLMKPSQLSHSQFYNLWHSQLSNT